MDPSSAVKTLGTQNSSDSTVPGEPERSILRQVGIAIALIISGLAACADPPEGFSSSPSNTPNPAVTFALDGCPVPDEAFCETALVAVNGIATGNAEALVAVSRPEVIDCAGSGGQDFMPGCETDDVLEGYLFWTGLFPMWTIDVLTKTDYLDRLETIFANVDPSYVDEHGDGAPRVLGVKKCGGSWTITWTVAVGDAGAPAERMGAFFEFTTRTEAPEDWATTGLVLLPLAYPETGYDEGEPSLDEIGCDDTTLPWK